MAVDEIASDADSDTEPVAVREEVLEEPQTCSSGRGRRGPNGTEEKASTRWPRPPESNASEGRRRRTCVGCRRTAEPTDWQRIAAADGKVAVGPANPGRGAWCCSPECFEPAAERGALDRALRRQLTSTELTSLRATLFN